MIEVKFDRDELASVIREVVRQEMEPVIRLLDDRRLSQKEAMEFLGIKSSATMRSLVAQGKIIPVPGKGRPKFLYSNLMKIKK